MAGAKRAGKARRARSSGGGKFLQSAINPKHKGYCTPMTKKTCTPRRKALAKRLKRGGDLYKKIHG
jgi:hypothetical protein